MQSKPQLSFLTLLLMISFAVVNAVLVSPALPAIANFFKISSNSTQQVVMWYLVGYAVGQLFYGPLSNRYGRKPALYMGVVLQIISSFICILAGMMHIFTLLIIGRFLVALGAGVGLKMAFTLVNECYEPVVVSQKVSYLMLAFAIMPGLSMAAGGFMNDHFGWISCFYLSAAYGILLIPLLKKLPETQKILDLDALNINHLFHSYIEQFKNIQLFSGGLMIGFTTCFIYVFSTISPFIAVNLLGMSSQMYGIANIFPSLGYIVGAIVSAKMAKIYPFYITVRKGIVMLSIGVVALIIAFGYHFPPLVALFIPITIIYFGESLIYPNVSTIAMDSAVDKSHASAVMNFLTIGLPTVAVLIVSSISVKIITLPAVFTGLCVAIIFTYKWIMSVKKCYVSQIG